MADNHDEKISEFCELLGASPENAEHFLAAAQWNVEQAATLYLDSQEGSGETSGTAPAEASDEPPAYTGPRTLDGRPAPADTANQSRSSQKKPAAAPRGGIATLGSLNQSSSASRPGRQHDSDDSDDEDYQPEGEPRDLFAGGEKSGLAVQDPTNANRNDPRKVVSDILKKAKANTARPGGEPSQTGPGPSRFHGSGQTLGGDDTPSRVIPNPNQAPPDVGPTQTRILHLWEEGFSIEDGPLRRFDDPSNAADLQMIRGGRAPLHLMGVRPDQPVDVQLMKHDSPYKAPPKVYKPFSGSGVRLGSPTPGGSSNAPASEPAAAAPAPASTSVPDMEIDPSQPTLNIRIQLANGTRLPARFNTSHTVGDVYSFISRAYPGSNERAWVLATTFPNKDHTDKSQVLGDMAEFKRGGTAVQKWV
ncbi:protein phosphatase regulator [Clarireedia jacksonii]